MHILLVQTGFLGDIILSSAVIDRLVELYPHSAIDVLTTPAGADLLRFHPRVRSVISFDKRGSQSGLRGLISLATVLRRRQYDVAFSLHKSLRSGALIWLARIPKRYGFSEAPGRIFYTTAVPRSDLSHEVLRNLAILRAIGEEPNEASSRLSLYLSSDAKNKARDILSQFIRPIIGLAPGSVWATKRWTVEGFAQLAKALVKRGFDVVLIGGASDKDVARQIEQLCDGDAKNLVGLLNLVESAAVVGNLRLLVSNDSAPLHMASALGVPVVATFCATIPEFGYGPWKVENETVEVSGLSCRPCGPHGGMTCPTGTHACQKLLASSMVLAAVERVLLRGSGDSHSPLGDRQ